MRAAYSQSAELWSVIFSPRTFFYEFELSLDQCLKFLCSPYSLCDAGDLSYGTLDKHYRNELEVRSFRIDYVLYQQLHNKKMELLGGGYVETVMRSGAEEFWARSKLVRARFKKAQESRILSELTGFTIDLDKDLGIVIDQSAYLRKL